MSLLTSSKKYSFTSPGFDPLKINYRKLHRRRPKNSLIDFSAIPAVATSNAKSREDMPTRKDFTSDDICYSCIFENPLEIMDRIPKPVVPGVSFADKIPWVIEAPLNSATIIQSVLDPHKRYAIYKAKHTYRGRNRNIENPTPEKVEEHRQLYENYLRFQGHLEEDRWVSFIILDPEDIRTIREKFQDLYDTTKLLYISLPWFDTEGRKTLVHPWSFTLKEYATPRNAPYTRKKDGFPLSHTVHTTEFSTT